MHAGTNPRIPTSKKTKPKRIAAVFTIVTSYWIKTPMLMAVAAFNDKPKTAKQKGPLAV